MRFGPGHESLNKKQNGRQSYCFEWLKGHKVGIFVKKVLRKGLKKSRNFAFSNLPFTRQHNISLNGTKSKIFDRVSRKCFINNLITYGYKHARLVSAMRILQAKLNDSDVKFKIYYKYGNVASKETYLNAF